MTEPRPVQRLTQQEFQAVIDLVVAYTGREPDKTLVETWAAQSAIGRWTYPEAAHAIHMWASTRGPRDFLEPSDVTRTLRSVRSRAADTFELPIIPAGLSNADYPAWLRARRDVHVDAIVQRWATTGEEPPTRAPAGPPPNQIGQRRLAELTAGAFHDIPSAADAAGNPPTADAMEVRATAFSASCPYCGARPSQPCTRSGAAGRVRINRPHPARTALAATSKEAS